MHLRSAVTTIAGCAVMGLTLLAGTAQAAQPRTSIQGGRSQGVPAAKKTKKLKGKLYHAFGSLLEEYEACPEASTRGCNFEIYSKTKVWTYSEFAPLEEPYGPYEEFKEKIGKKTYTYADFYYYYEPCVIATEKVKGNYYGGWFCENEEGAFEELETLAIIK